MRFKYILFDLDGTLLPMDKKRFLDGYLNALAARMSPYLPPGEFIDHLLASTRAMVVNSDPGRTNREVFIEDFFARTGLPEDEILPVFDRFYREDFPDLAPLTRPTALAPKVLRRVLESGADIVIATNPVFPRAAVEERLRWAVGTGFPFRLVTTYEIMHFCKPNPMYYEEIAAYLGAPPERCLMLGNDVEEDLVAAETGMSTYLVEDQAIHRGIRPCNPDYRGSLEDCYRFLAGLTT
ncbi:MAG: HAD family hydrolase [Bacillota bacterium]